MSFKYTLRKGDKGQEVARLQLKVGADPDGNFGSGTQKSVKEYQDDNNLTVDGIAGPHTLGSLGIGG